ncbi:MAG: hypothetical protein GY786_01145, partial [Proteobacteria bacterium]|nr:hypothetical protein [Pseudomonadota bacterium]
MQNQPEPIFSTSLNRPDFYFKIDAQSLISVIDLKGDQIVDNFGDITTQQRKLLDSIHSLQDDERFIVDWEVKEQGISLHTHPELLEILIGCPNICDEHLLPIKYHSVEGKLVLRIEKDNLLVSTLHLETPEG